MSNGIDVDGVVVTTAQWQQLAAARDLSFAVVRCFCNANGGEIDKSCLATMRNAREAGIVDLDVYHFPVIRDRTPEDQAQMTIQFVAQSDLAPGVIWLDVEQGGTPWHDDPNENLDFISRWVATVKKAGYTPGVYCGTDGWKAITAGSQEFADVPLWWSSHGKAFVSFGGWIAAHTTQTHYDEPFQGFLIDIDTRP